jgi:hypothetical protein
MNTDERIKATEAVIDRLQSKVARARLDMLAAIEAYTNAQIELANASARLDTLKDAQ